MEQKRHSKKFLILVLPLIIVLSATLGFLFTYRSKADYEAEAITYRNDIITKAELVSKAIETPQDEVKLKAATTDYTNSINNFKQALDKIKTPTLGSDQKQKNQDFIILSEDLVPKAHAYLKTFEDKNLNPEVAIQEYNKVLEEMNSKTETLNPKP